MTLRFDPGIHKDVSFHTTKQLVNRIAPRLIHHMQVGATRREGRRPAQPFRQLAEKLALAQGLDENLVEARGEEPPPISRERVRRDSDDPQALPKVYTEECPHLGCSVDFKEDRKQFVCPCHNSTFAKDGKRINPESAVAPRDLDELVDVEIRNDNELWVIYKKFRSGIEEKTEV